MDESSEKKREPLTEKLLRRENLRKQEVVRKREEKEITKASTESVGYFRATFTEKMSKIYETLHNLKPEDENNKEDLAKQLNNITTDITNLQKYVASSTLFLTAYEVRKAQQHIQCLEKEFRATEEKLLPKPKFTFKSRKLIAKKSVDVLDSTLVSKPSISKMLSEQLFIDRSTGFSHRKGEKLVLIQEDINQKDVSLTSLENCTVKLLGAASALQVTSLKNCFVFCGPVAASIFIDNCINCKFLLPCQQLRVHNTTLCDFYIYVKSRAIIEDTQKVRFAPFNWSYENMETHFEAVGFEINVNNWDSVDDFNWLVRDVPSPNWQILNEAERITDWSVYDNIDG